MTEKRLKECKRKYYLKNKEKISSYNKVYYIRNKEKFSILAKEYRISNKDKIATRSKEYRQKNIKILSISKKKYREENKEKIAYHNREYRQKNIDKISLKKKMYYLNNKNKVYINNKKQFKQKYGVDINYTLRHILRGRLETALKNRSKVGSAVKDLGCTIGQLMDHLQKQFQPGMSWSNHGLFGWHIDHIKPLSSFNLENREELLEACHYTNLQPLWAEINLEKGSKLITGIDYVGKN